MGTFDHFDTTRTTFERSMMSPGLPETTLGDRHDTQPGELPSVVPEGAPDTLSDALRFIVEHSVERPEDN